MRRHPLRAILLILLAVLALPYVLTPFYALGRPVSTLMIGRFLTGSPVSRTWIDLDDMAPVLPLSIVAAEDAKFCVHHGIDWEALNDVLEDAGDGEVARGGSTITQQVAKNLFLWPGRSFIRKALEFPLALWIDAVLGKRRVLELYLNIAELGPNGQFGVEEGARYAFGRSASAVSPSEAALLASILPNPAARSARQPKPGLRRLAAIHQRQAQSAAIVTCWTRNRRI